MMRTLTAVCRGLLFFFFYLYRWGLSPILYSFFGGGCRFTPSCSLYSLRCFQQKPFCVAFQLMLMRLLRCHPFW